MLYILSNDTKPTNLHRRKFPSQPMGWDKKFKSNCAQLDLNFLSKKGSIFLFYTTIISETVWDFSIWLKEFIM